MNEVEARTRVELVARAVRSPSGEFGPDGSTCDVGAADVLAGRVGGDAVGTVDRVGARERSIPADPKVGASAGGEDCGDEVPWPAGIAGVPGHALLLVSTLLKLLPE